MTNKEALVRGVLSGFSVDSFQADKVLLDAGVNGGTEYIASNEKAIDECAVRLLYSHCISSVSEGGYSISYSREAVENLINRLCNKWGLDNPLQPTIKAINLW
jgi:hypothetical protein